MELCYDYQREGAQQVPWRIYALASGAYLEVLGGGHFVYFAIGDRLKECLGRFIVSGRIHDWQVTFADPEQARAAYQQPEPYILEKVL